MRMTGALSRLGMFTVLGVALAAGPALGDVICKKKSGAMFIRAACKPKETAVNLASFGAVGPQGAQGAQGPQGPQGFQGPPGLSATALWAVVNGDGSLARGSHVASTSQPFGTGTYEVIFDQDVSACSFLATLSDPGDSNQGGPGEIGTTGRLTTNDGVFVTVFDSSGAYANAPFALAVFCP